MRGRVKVEPTKFNFGTTCPSPFVIKIISNPIPSKSTSYVNLYAIQLDPYSIYTTTTEFNHFKVDFYLHISIFSIHCTKPTYATFDKTLKLSKMKSKITFNTLEYSSQ